MTVLIKIYSRDFQCEAISKNRSASGNVTGKSKVISSSFGHRCSGFLCH